MQEIFSVTTLSSLSASVTNVKVVKTETSFLKVLDKTLQNDFFCYS